MIRKTFHLCLLLSALFGTVQAQQRTTLSAQIYGYQRDMVYFDCVQTPLIRQEFHTNPGEEHLYSFETDEPVCLLVNGRTALLLQPGDSLHVDIRYEGRNIQSIDFSGTDEAVANNQALRNVDLLKRDMRYKEQLLGCAALDIKPAQRIADSHTLYNKVKEMLAKPESGLSKAASDYIMAGIEANLNLSLMEYPVMYASVRRLPVEKQEIGDYWKLMDDYRPANNAAALSNPDYVSMLMRYCFYLNEKAAVAKGKKYVMPDRFEEMYHELAAFFTDPATKDAVLYQLICNFIRGGKEIERVDPVLKDYRENHNQDSKYIRILDNLLQ